MSEKSGAFVPAATWIPLPTETCFIDEGETECDIAVPHAAKTKAAAGTARSFFIAIYITTTGRGADGLDGALRDGTL